MFKQLNYTLSGLATEKDPVRAEPSNSSSAAHISQSF